MEILQHDISLQEDLKWSELKNLRQRIIDLLNQLPQETNEIIHYERMAADFDKYLKMSSQIENHYDRIKENLLNSRKSLKGNK